MMQFRIIQPNGTIRWFNLKRNAHREGGPAFLYKDGTKCWCKDGFYHRLDGPAIEYSNRDKEWYKEGKRHREDGPALECANGDKRWYYNDQYIDCKDQETFGRIIKLKAFW